ncbi:uncharacterized protein LOC127102817 [Lathyrus oleraceus]|uniref:uncharacterized protein LOC127102817 n=1 Tax=Pisum sativum TaxID=3888 RepID=UPI0021D2937A|nr:uncharacterized protein LOC127102817 [Pisum sativum]
MSDTNRILNSLPFLDVVTHGVPELDENATDAQRVAHKEAKKKDCKAAYCIQSAVGSTNFNRISHAESANEAWDILVEYYEGCEKVKVVKLQILRQKYELLQMGEDEKIAGYVSKVQNPVHLMKGCGETLTNKMIVEKEIHMLTFHFDHAIVTIQESNNLETMKLEDLVGSLEARKEEGANRALQDSNDYEDMVVMVIVGDDHVESKIWFLDSGCSNHMTFQKVWLADFDSSNKSKVKLADNSSLQAEGTGDIVFQRSDEGKAMIKDVLYVPRMKCNLLSVGQLIEISFSVIMKDGALELFET